MFAFRLAEKLGMTVWQMLNSMPASEMTEWRAYFMLQAERNGGEQQKTLGEADIKAMFGGRVVKKGS